MFDMLNRFKDFLSKYIKLTESLFITLFVTFMLFKCLYFQFSSRLNKAPYFTLNNFLMLISSISVLLIIVSLSLFLFNKKRLIAIFILNVLLTTLLIADTNFFRYYYNLITIPIIFQLNPKMISTVDQSIASLFQVKDILYIVDIPFMLAALIKLHKKGITSIHFPKRIRKSIVTLAVALVIILSVSSISNISSYAYSNNYSAKSLGVFYSHFYNTKLFIEKNVLEDENTAKEEKTEVEKYFESRNVKKKIPIFNTSMKV